METYLSEQEAMDQIYADMAKYEKEMHGANMKLLADNKIPYKDLKEVLGCCTVTEHFEIVGEPEGNDQEEQCGIFKCVFVDQWSVGYGGDSFEGFIYGMFENNKWLKIPYSC